MSQSRIIMRCVYLGLPQGAFALANAGHDMSEPAIQHLLMTAQANLLLCFLWDRIRSVRMLISSNAGVMQHHHLVFSAH